jgi:hypothetical protein
MSPTIPQPPAPLQVRRPPAQHGGKVVHIRLCAEAMASPFDHLTARLVLDHHRAGTLPEGVVAALLAGVGLPQ